MSGTVNKSNKDVCCDSNLVLFGQTAECLLLNWLRTSKCITRNVSQLRYEGLINRTDVHTSKGVSFWEDNEVDLIRGGNLYSLSIQFKVALGERKITIGTISSPRVGVVISKHADSQALSNLG